MKYLAILLVVVAVVATTHAQVKVGSELTLGDLGETPTLDAETQAVIKEAPDDEAKLAAIQSLVATNVAQSNWVADAEARVLTKLGQEAAAVDAAKRISEPDGAANTEVWVRFNSSNYSKVIEVGEPWLAKPAAEIRDIYRLRMADTMARAIKASGGNSAVTRGERVRVLTAALTNIEHTTLFNLTNKDTVPVPQLVTRLVDYLRRKAAPGEGRETVLRHLIRITPVTTNTVKTVGDWKGWLAWHGGTNVLLSDVVQDSELVKVVDLHAADSVARALERGAVSDGPGRSNAVRVLTLALSNVEPATLSRLGYTQSSSVPKLVVRLVRFVQQAGAPDAEREAMLRHLIGLVPVTERTCRTIGEWKGWLARHGHTDVVLNDVVEGANSLELLNLYAEHVERNVPLPYANSVFGEAYQRRDVAAMRRYLDSVTK